MRDHARHLLLQELAVHCFRCLELFDDVRVRSHSEILQACEADLSVLHLALRTCRSASCVVLDRTAASLVILFSSVSKGVSDQI